jgi:hypothetical protein
MSICRVSTCSHIDDATARALKETRANVEYLINHEEHERNVLKTSGFALRLSKNFCTEWRQRREDWVGSLLRKDVQHREMRAEKFARDCLSSSVVSNKCRNDSSFSSQGSSNGSKKRKVPSHTSPKTWAQHARDQNFDLWSMIKFVRVFSTHTGTMEYKQVLCMDFLDFVLVRVPQFYDATRDLVCAVSSAQKYGFDVPRFYVHVISCLPTDQRQLSNVIRLIEDAEKEKTNAAGGRPVLLYNFFDTLNREDLNRREVYEQNPPPTFPWIFR